MIVAIGILQTCLMVMVQGIRFLTSEGCTTICLLKLHSTKDKTFAAAAAILARLCELAEVMAYSCDPYG